MPLFAIESVFVKSENRKQARFFGHVEQMHESRCFRESAARWVASRVTTRTCSRTLREKSAYYRIVCLSCHAGRGCSLPRPESLAQGRDDRCIDCHMPRSANEQVPHTASTLHRSPASRTRPVRSPSLVALRAVLMVP